ncbi:glucosaminidase domain-containing protein [Lysobacter sp. K5869]|uniref:XVIPCD domain-containing protein n=1 Tax=Lysobacter sp. K5869 TaxID=2820808 RepID=UPI001C063753|nr:XVIPCD domain-containing protein [Lysobacter sp. K5869]QWP75111.1 glucosaminidase domain-containing protein [Lysobacter sp. K5869]
MGNKEEFIADLYPAAVRVSKQTGMSAELILAQAALETGWGEKVLPGTNNIFNIKDSKGWDGPTKSFNVWEIEGGKKVWKDQDFRVYGSMDEALTDRVKFLKENGRYAKAGLFDEGTLGDLKKEAGALQKAGYATDPHYAEQLAKVFNGPTMRRGIALAESRGAPELPEHKPGEHKPGEHKPAAPAKPADAMADGRLRQGEDGPAVKAMQERLNELGFRDAKGHPLKPDGDFGPATKHALQQAQRAYGLDDDGVAGPKTLDALKKAPPEKAAPEKAEPGALLSDPANRDNGMYKQAVAGLEKLGPNAFGNRQELERAAGTLTYEAKVSGLSSIDKVVLNTNGTGLFAVQGELNDPAARRVHADKAQAASVPLERSSEQLRQDVPQQAQTPNAQTQERAPKVMSA